MVGTHPGRAIGARLARAMRMLPLLAALTLSARVALYSSASVDESGQLHIVLDSGKEILPRKTQGQVSFGSPLISPDRRTVGWLVNYADPGAINYVGDPIAGKLVIYRSGLVLHTFMTEQTFWDWRFQDGAKRVAYSTGPTHGGAAECVLRDVKSGSIMASWPVRSGSEAPAWARNLRRQ